MIAGHAFELLIEGQEQSLIQNRALVARLCEKRMGAIEQLIACNIPKEPQQWRNSCSTRARSSAPGSALFAS
jgi:hypothetical protein